MKKTIGFALIWPFGIACTAGLDISPNETPGTGGGFGAGGAAGSGIVVSGGAGGGTGGNVVLDAGTEGIRGSIDTGNLALPCDIANILSVRCQQCHSNPPVAGAPMPLMTYRDLIAASKSDPTTSTAALALARMQSVARPMPPPPAAPATPSEIASVQTWVSAGMPGGSCVDAGPVPDAGNPFGSPPICTSGRIAAGPEGPDMDPGQTCIACHATNEGPDFIVAGTVFPTAHEPNNCTSTAPAAANATVVIVDANNRTFTLTVNSVGNFYSSSAIVRPYRAKVVVGANERVMADAQTSGDCNGCHTQSGANSAPGRILMP